MGCFGMVFTGWSNGVQIRTVKSSEPEISFDPSFDHSRQLTHPLWPFKGKYLKAEKNISSFRIRVLTTFYGFETFVKIGLYT